MEKALTKVGSFWIAKKAKEEISSIGDDLSRFSGTVEEKAKWVFDKLKGKPRKSLPELLREHGLPAGLFPRNVTCYEFDLQGRIRHKVRRPCEGDVDQGKLSGVEGMKTKVLVWVKVTQVHVEGFRSDKVCFTAGVKKLRPKDAYDTPGKRSTLTNSEVMVDYKLLLSSYLLLLLLPPIFLLCHGVLDYYS
ncbi:unnamed protein product [Spirodela intermedia]|uniref:Uncharacterized protein n=1 Tax=Spirodela intermedia TaxID=51605 RepID=A0A7I8JB36_SPIIN|nr:unnamed protein product [Spirodela intermedia]CAA6667377.1 unnamed protein product [Spirodela intermedia]